MTQTIVKESEIYWPCEPNKKRGSPQSCMFEYIQYWQFRVFFHPLPSLVDQRLFKNTVVVIWLLVDNGFIFVFYDDDGDIVVTFVTGGFRAASSHTIWIQMTVLTCVISNGGTWGILILRISKKEWKKYNSNIRIPPLTHLCLASFKKDST